MQYKELSLKRLPTLHAY